MNRTARAALNWALMLVGAIWVWPWMLFNFIFAAEFRDYRTGERSIFE